MSSKNRNQHHAVIQVWDTDPVDAVLTERPAPELKGGSLRLHLPKPHPRPKLYPPGTAGFRFWVAADALRRGADFWARIAGIERWQLGRKLPVLLDDGDLLNAYYDREAIRFFRGQGPNGHVYSGESADVLCHELGHAVLDALRPELFHVAAQEIAAFHEAFGDISAMCAALQARSFRVSLVDEVGRELFRDSRLSRLASQLGAALRHMVPDAVDGRCLRNAANSFCYHKPELLPPRGPAAMLSSEPHSFSRIFTAASLEIMAAIFKLQVGRDEPSEEALAQSCDDFARILVRAIRSSSVVGSWYAQVAANMVLHAGRLDQRYPALLRQVFVQRAILSLPSAAALRQADGLDGEDVATADRLAEIMLAVNHLGMDRGIVAVAPSGGSRVRVAAGPADHLRATGAGDAAQDFVDDLVRRGRLEFADGADGVFANKRNTSHRLVDGDGGLRLERTRFDCGWIG